MILGFIYFWFPMGKSSWVHSRTQGLFPLVVDGTVYHGYCKNCFSLVVDEEWDRGHDPSILVCLGCFCWTWSWNWHVSEPCVWWFQNYVASATKFELCVVITLFIFRCMLNYMRTLCNMWHVCWIMYDLGLYVGYDLRSFTTLDELPGLYGLKYDSTTTPVVAIVLVLL